MTGFGYGARALLVFALLGCTGPGDASRTITPAGGKADGLGFEPGIYYVYDVPWEEDGGLVVALFEAPEGLRGGYAGHYDYSRFVADEETTEYVSGLFKIVGEEDEMRLVLEDADGGTVTELRFEDGRLYEGDAYFYAMNLLHDDNILAGCMAFDVVDFQFEEGFTVWEYPSLRVEREADGTHTVGIGAARFDASEAEITVTDGDGTLEATVTLEYGTKFILEIPTTVPSRGRALVSEDGEEPHLMASIVCQVPAPSDEPPVAHFSCTTRRTEADGTATIEFGVVSLDDHDAMDIHWPDDVEEPIRVAPESSSAYTLVGGIADGYLTWRDDKLRLFTDQIGYEFGELELYENSDYTRGYFRFERLDPENTRFYTEVDCTHD